ncbi:MAG: ABC transporter ATP-binding protein [Candidatus Omnitrophica bacterium]|nr:ABC transporter ATP-binding protein [Candidatus Omnitrophota bacterium]
MIFNKENFIKEYFRLLQLARRNLYYLLAGVGCMVVSTLFSGIQVGAIIPLADRILNDKPIVLPEHLPQFLVDLAYRLNTLDRHFLFYSLIFIVPVFAIFQGVFGYLQNYFMNVAAQKTVAETRGRIFRKYQELSLDFYSQKRQGELLARITHDIPYISNAISGGLSDMVFQSLQVIMFAIVALVISWKTVLFILIVFPLNALIIYAIGKTIKKQSRNSQEAMADLNSILVEANQGVAIVKAFLREEHEIERFEETSQRYYKATLKGICRNILLSPITSIFMAVAISAVFWMGGSDVMAGKVSFGVFAFFILSLISIYRPFNKLTAVYGTNQQAMPAVKRVYNILDLKSKIMDAKDAVICPVPQQGIALEGVFFRYNKSEEDWTLQDLSHDFEVGKTTALVGPTGCGKTTITNLLLRFYDPDQGQILVDGKDIRGLTVVSLRQHMGLVTQDMILFNETIRANLQYGKLDATDEEIYEAARKALALEFIEKMPRGLDTVIGDRGFKLSGGQKQRLCIARAILKNPRILLLDEATSALDAESEYFVQQALDNLMKDRTVIVIAHRLSTIRNADCILVMDQGRIVQKGVHDELLKTSELYARLASYHFNQ